MFKYETCVFSRSNQKAGHTEALLPQICYIFFPLFPALLFEREKEREYETCLCTSKKENMKQCLNMKLVSSLAQTREDTCLTAFLEHVCGRLAQTREDTLIERNPPPRGGFLFIMFPDQEPCVRGPPSKNLVQILRGGSSYTRLLMREHSKKETPPGGGVSFDQHV